mgnify:CR=1 FL=1
MNENQVNENKNRILLVIVIITLLIVVLYFGVAAYKDKKVEPNQIKVNLSQIYVSDYEIMKFDKYFIETMDHKIYGISYNNFYIHFHVVHKHFSIQPFDAIHQYSV